MSQFRKRQMPVGKENNSSQDTQATGGGSVGQTQTQSPQFKISRFTTILLAAAVLSAGFILYRSRWQILPETYALCSREGSQIYTVDDANPRAECILVHESRIVATGTVENVKKLLTSHQAAVKRGLPFGGIFSGSTMRYVPAGSIVVPGLSDSHAHILEYGASRQIPLESGKTVDETVMTVRQYIVADSELFRNKTKFVEGWGWDHTGWPSAEWPTAEDLDNDLVVKGRPIVLQSKDGHALWVSPKVLELMSPIPDKVDGGIILRHPDGRPTGVFIDNAQELVVRPPLTNSDLLKRFSATVEDAVSAGLTSIHDAGFDPMSLRFFKSQASKGVLPIRIYGMTYFDEAGEYWGNKTEPIIGLGGRLNARSVKIFADGALRSGGAALYEPYSDNPGIHGVMRISTDVLHTVIPRFLRDGWQVNVHAIGDRANAIVLDAFEAALQGVNVTALRPRLEHAQIMTKADMVRLGKLGVIASIQPTHAISDMWFAEDRLGPERVKGLYAFRSLIDSGARITLGSDFPVENINPLSGFYAAITRVAPDQTSPHGPGGWFPEQRLTRDEALRGMTIDPAYASFTEAFLGSLTPGKLADYIVLSRDIMTIPPAEVLTTKVIATVIDGRPVYGNV